MRIALTIPHFDASRGGAEGFAARTVRGLVERGHSVAVFAEKGASAEVPVSLGPLHEAGHRIAGEADVFHLDWGLNVPADLHRLGGGIHAAFCRYNAMSVHPLLRPYKRLEHLLAPKHIRIRRREAPLLGRPQAHFLAVSEFVANHLKARRDIAPERVFTLVNGVPVERFNFHDRIRFRKDIRKVFGLDDTHVAYLFVAHNPRLKNFALLRRVFEDFHRHVPSARLIVLGRKIPTVRAPWLIAAGEVSQPERIYAAADAMLHPTYFDACANVVLEAMACGCPVVSSTFNGSAEIIQHGINGYVLPVAGRPACEIRNHWLDAMTALAENPGARRKMGRAAASFIRSRQTMDAYVERLETIIRQIDASATRENPRDNGLA